MSNTIDNAMNASRIHLQAYGIMNRMQTQKGIITEIYGDSK